MDLQDLQKLKEEINDLALDEKFKKRLNIILDEAIARGYVYDDEKEEVLSVLVPYVASIDTVLTSYDEILEADEALDDEVAVAADEIIERTEAIYQSSETQANSE